MQVFYIRLTAVPVRLLRPATGGTLPSPLPPDVSGYAVLDSSGAPPPRMLSAHGGFMHDRRKV